MATTDIDAKMLVRSRSEGVVISGEAAEVVSSSLRNMLVTAMGKVEFDNVEKLAKCFDTLQGLGDLSIRQYKQVDTVRKAPEWDWKDEVIEQMRLRVARITYAIGQLRAILGQLGNGYQNLPALKAIEDACGEALAARCNVATKELFRGSDSDEDAKGEETKA